MTSPDLSIIIVNWRSQAFVGECLAALFDKRTALTYEVFVVDNASFDGIADLLAARFPQVTFIQCERNLGFAGANNLAFSRCCGRNVLFLNPDTEVQGDAIQTLVSALESLPDAGLIGARLLNSDLSLQTNCVTAIPTLLNQIFSCDLLRTWFPNWKMWGMEPLLQNDDAPAQVGAISGACMLGRRYVLAGVGGFSPEYFMYLEDMDLCVKIARAGSAIYYVPQATIIHHGGGSSALRQENHFSSIMLRRSLISFFRRYHGRTYAASYRACLVLVSAVRVLLLMLALPVLLKGGGFPTAFKPLKKWCGIFLWSVGATPWTSPKTHPNTYSSVTSCKLPGASA